MIVLLGAIFGAEAKIYQTAAIENSSIISQDLVANERGVVFRAQQRVCLRQDMLIFANNGTVTLYNNGVRNPNGTGRYTITRQGTQGEILITFEGLQPIRVRANMTGGHTLNSITFQGEHWSRCR